VAREDSYRAEARVELAKLLAAAEEFYRHGLAITDTETWVHSGVERATTLADNTERSMQIVQERLATASLLLTDQPLQEALARLQNAANRAAAVIHETVDSFWESRMPRSFISERRERWKEFAAAREELHSLGLSLLRPSIRDPAKSLRRSSD
jgi:hypothetical protein